VFDQYHPVVYLAQLSRYMEFQLSDFSDTALLDVGPTTAPESRDMSSESLHHTRTLLSIMHIHVAAKV